MRVVFITCDSRHRDDEENRGIEMIEKLIFSVVNKSIVLGCRKSVCNDASLYKHET